MLPTRSKVQSVEIAILGGFAVRDPSGAPIRISSKKTRALLAVLALAPDMAAPRAQLADLLWSDRDDEGARSNLRQALAVLRSELHPAAPGMLATDGDVVSLRQEQVSIDAVEFLRQTRTGDVPSLHRAASLYGGELLAGFDVKAPAFEDWLSAKRADLKDAAIRVLDGLAALQSGAARITTLRRLLALDMLREASHRALVRAFADQGEHGLALKQFEACRKLLREEFDAAPSPETQAVGDLLAGRTVAPTARSMAADGAEEDSRPSIAVLPLANLRDDPRQQYICDGFSEDIVTELVRYRSLRVLGSFSSFAARDLMPDAGAAFERLKTRYLVTGSFRSVGAEVQIGIQLLASGSGDVVWADRIRGAAEDLAAFQIEAVTRIASHVESHVARHAGAGTTTSPTPRDWRAYDFVLRGRYALFRYEIDTAEGHLRQAIAIDPRSSHAHAWLAMLLVVRSWRRGGGPDLVDAARTHARLAVHADPDNATAHCAMGYVRQYGGDLEAAGPHYERAMALNPNDTRILTYAGMWWTFMGEPGKGLALMDRALDREPYPNAGVWGMRANALYQLADYTGAMASIDRMTSLSAWDLPYAVAALARIGDEESGRRLRATYRPKLLREFDTLTHHATYEPYRLPRHSEHLLEGLDLALKLARQP